MVALEVLDKDWMEDAVREGPMGLRVLVADDSVFIRDIIRHHLERLGFRVVAEAANAAQALALFKTLKPDLVTLDIIMPQVDGIDSLAAFRGIKREDPDVPVLIVSAVPFDTSRDAFMNEGALDYVIKPFSRSSFERIRRKLGAIYPEVAAIPRVGERENRMRRSQ